ncbi:MAG: rod-binding protein [Gemmatimonadaceae bacterium]|nr:rod-binding protein [Gemmatimonadaceae bacterium]
MNPIGRDAGPITPAGDDRRLREAARALEGVFVAQLFKAMRETVPQDGALSGGAGEEMFSSMLDERMADLVPTQWNSDLGDALLRQFRTRLAPTQGADPSAP